MQELAAVLKVARDNASQVDREAAFPLAAVDALRGSGLLGLTLPADVGGMGAGPGDFADVLTQLAAACGSTAMVYLMHVSAAMAVAAAPPPGRPDLLPRLANGDLLATLALSEAGSRSHFWAPVSQAALDGDAIRLKVRKSWVTSAGYADVYVVSSLTPPEVAPAEGASDLYVVDAGTDGVEVAGAWHGLGLRGNASAPMTFDLTVPQPDRLGVAGSGLGLKLETIMPWFNLGNAAVSVGVSQAAVDAAVAHASAVRFEHLGESLAQLPTIRAQLARMALDLAATRAYLSTAARAIAAPDGQTPLHVLGITAYANDAALRITDTAMRVCGGAAFSEHLQLDRYFRDARAGHVMAPTADALYDFYGKALTGQPLF
jgi:alkylation response protein AidB-like acyl-CoA dehydrogenase